MNIYLQLMDRIEVEGEVGGEGVEEGEGEGEVDVHCRGCRIVLRGCRTVHKLLVSRSGNNGTQTALIRCFKVFSSRVGLQMDSTG